MIFPICFEIIPPPRNFIQHCFKVNEKFEFYLILWVHRKVSRLVSKSEWPIILIFNSIIAFGNLFGYLFDFGKFLTFYPRTDLVSFGFNKCLCTHIVRNVVFEDARLFYFWGLIRGQLFQGNIYYYISFGLFPIISRQ